MKTITKYIRKRNGFTLIELVVVLAILGIIIAIAVPAYNNIQANSEWKADLATANTIGKAAELYYYNEKEAPTAISDLAPNYLDAVPTPQYTDSGATTFILTMNGAKAQVDYNTGTNLYPTPPADRPTS